MAWIEISNGQGGGGVIAAATINTIGAKLLVAMVATYIGDYTVPNIVTDTDGNTWVLGINSVSGQTNNDATGLRINYYYCINPITSVSNTVTFTDGTNVYPGIIVYAFGITGTITAGSYVGSGVNVTPTSVGIPIGGVGDLVISAIETTNPAASINSGFATPVTNPYFDGVHMGISTSWKEVAGGEDPEWSDVGNPALINFNFSVSSSPVVGSGSLEGGEALILKLLD